MIKLELVQGSVEIQNKLHLNCILPRKGLELDTSKDFHYAVKSGQDSWAIIRSDGKDIVLRPNSVLQLTNIKSKLNKGSLSKSAKLVVGKIWASMGGPSEDDSAGGGGGIRG